MLIIAKNRYKIYDNYAVIFLDRLNGDTLETKISLCDLEKVLQFPNKWRTHYYGSTGNYYCTAHTPALNGKRRPQPLHRFVMSNPEGLDVDHINHDTLDNRRENLRVVTRQENAMNRKGANKGSKSGIRGISWDGRWSNWRVRVTESGKLVNIGQTKDLEEAKLMLENYKRERR